MKKTMNKPTAMVAVILLLANLILCVNGINSDPKYDIPPPRESFAYPIAEEPSSVVLTESLPTLFAPNVTTSTTYTGSNVNGQNYSRWSATVKSYLTQSDSQTIMRVQGDASTGILVEYYDLSYNLISTRIVTKELPIFGGFYETSSNYYIISGQENLSQSAATEVVRVTKYDKSWNKISIASLTDCNTIRPFYAGSLRVSQYGNYLIIRTSHLMYTSADGLNHQANMTFQVDTTAAPMAITDKLGTGYVSHSFNQFVGLEGNKLIAVDHGDAYPRSIVLIKYSKDVSTGQFNSTCTNTPIISFPGTIGNNTTGASVGAFEISGTHYLIAGNSVVQDAANTSRTTRNIYVASVSKSTSAVTMNWITNLSEGTTSTTTPHMVKIATDTYVLMWSQGDQVYYTQINGAGEKVGAIYNFTGALSDCVPMVAAGKIIWYTWSNETVKFYEINTSDPDSSKGRIIDNGSTPDVLYRTHIQDVGWQDYSGNGGTSGTSGRSLRLEGIEIEISGNANLGVQYTTHVQDYGWLPWSSNDEMSGTEAESKRLEAIKIQLTGADKDLYDVYYRVHAQDYGWLDWAANGAAAGTAGYSKRLEAIEIILVEKGAPAPGSVARPYVANGGTDQVPGATTSNVAYQTHIQNVGWQGYRYNEQMSGTSGRSLRLEGIKIRLSNKQYTGGITYATHIQSIGWQEYKSNGEMSGTSEQSLRLEAIKIELTGEMANQYDVYYRVHIQDFGWLGWAKNGEESGSQGQSKRLEGIEIVLVEKGGAAPGTTDNRFIS